MTGDRDARANDAFKDDLVGRTVEAYQILALLGKGGMGEVYKARDLRLDRLVALKIVAPLYSRDPEFVSRFEREARAASSLSHPAIAQVHWTGRFEGRPYYVMEYVDGRSLADILRAEGKISGFRCLSFLIQAAEGLQAALANGIIHRDIKPANLMTDSRGQLKIVDFGLARRLAGDQTLTQSDCVLGTPRYMSPEQAVGGTVDHRSDIYSLGATFYHLFAGTPPFDADTPIALMMKHVNDPLPPLRERNPRVPTGICSIVEKALAKRPEDRYQDYGELLADLDAARSGRVDGSNLFAASETIPSRTTRSRAGAAVGGGRGLTWLAFAVAAVALAIAIAPRLVQRAGDSGSPAPQAVAAPSGEADSGPAADMPDRPSEADDTTGDTSAAGQDEPAASLPALPRRTPSRPPGSLFDMAFTAKTMAAMRQLSTLLQVHFAEHEEYPASLVEVAERNEMYAEDLRDGWGRDLLYRRLDPHRFRLTSLGVDGLLGTDDDLVIENGRVIQGQAEPMLPPFGRP